MRLAQFLPICIADAIGERRLIGWAEADAALGECQIEAVIPQSGLRNADAKDERFARWGTA